MDAEEITEIVEVIVVEVFKHFIILHPNTWIYFSRSTVEAEGFRARMATRLHQLLLPFFGSVPLTHLYNHIWLIGHGTRFYSSVLMLSEKVVH